VATDEKNDEVASTSYARHPSALPGVLNMSTPAAIRETLTGVLNMSTNAAMRASFLQQYRMTTLMKQQSNHMGTVRDAFKVQISMVQHTKQFNRDTLLGMTIWLKEKLGEEKNGERSGGEDQEGHSGDGGLDEADPAGVSGHDEGLEGDIGKEMDNLVDRYFADVEKMDEDLQIIELTELEGLFFNDAGVRQMLSDGEKWLMTHSNKCS
jgi:hypothetical protein